MSALRITAIAVTAVLLGAIAACGQSGPLYLPGNPSDVQQVSPPPQDSDKDDEDDAAP